MNAKNILLSLLAAAVIAAAPAAALAADAEQPVRQCPRHMIGCEHADTHKPCLTEEQKAQIAEKKAECAKKRAELAEKRAEQKAKIDALAKEHRAAIAPLREQLMQKRMELDALSPNPNVKPEELKALVGEIVSLRKQMRTMQNDFRNELAKLGAPCKPFRGHHPEHGFRGNCGPRPFHGGCEAMR